MKIKFSCVEGIAYEPKRQTEGAAGFDLCAAAGKRVQPGQTLLVPTGIRFEIPRRVVGSVSLRSSVGRRGLVMPNAPGRIDSDFRGEVGIVISNVGYEDQNIAKGSRIAQIIFESLPEVFMEYSEVLDETERGEEGFGSTGTGLAKETM